MQQNTQNCSLDIVRHLAMRLPKRSKRETGLILPKVALPTKLCVFARTGAEFMRLGPQANLQEYVLLIALRGSADVALDNIKLAITPGEALLIFPEQYHHYARARGRILWLFIAFSMDAADALQPLKHALVSLTPQLWTHVAACLRGYSHAHRALPYIGANMAVELWRLLMGLLERSQGVRHALPSRRVTLSWHYKVILKAREYIMAHIQAPIAIGDVAQHVGMSQTKLQKLFLKYQGCGVGETIRRARVARAGQLINRSDAMMKQIAFLCGFSSVYAFSRTFKHLTGHSPLAYRALLRRIHGEPGR